MKKDMIFTPLMMIIAAMLFMLRTTGMTAHIAISVFGVLVLITYTVLTKKGWKIPALEIIMRAFYGIALITGVVIMKVHTIAALSIIHKTGAALFIVTIAILFVHKLIKSKEA